MRTRFLIILFVLLLALLAYRELSPNPNSISLDVHDMPLSEVARQIEKQAGISIDVHNKVDAKVTLVVQNKPLEHVLALLTSQANASWASIYPIYSDTTSLEILRQWFRGQLMKKSPGWSNVQELFSDGSRIVHAPQSMEGKTVTLQLTNTPAPDAIMALSKAGQAHVVAEDGVVQPVQLKVESEPLQNAVDQLAAQLKKKWTHFYTITERPKTSIQLSEKPGERVEVVNHSDGRTEQRQVITRSPSPEERQRLDMLRRLSPAERKEFLASEMKQKAQNRFRESLKNSTPEQRIDRLRKNMHGSDEIEVGN